MFANCKWFSAEMMPEYGGKTGIMMDNSGLSMRSVCTACGALELTTVTVAASPACAINVNHSNNCCMLAGVYKNHRILP